MEPTEFEIQDCCYPFISYRVFENEEEVCLFNGYVIHLLAIVFSKNFKGSTFCHPSVATVLSKTTNTLLANIQSR